jgi:hypothetical protein
MVPSYRGRARILGALAALSIAVGSLHGGQVTRAATGDPVLLNEALVSHVGADVAEFVELYGMEGTSLAGLALLAVEGDSSQTPGRVDFRLDFASTAHLGGNGFYLVGNPLGLGAAYGVTPDVAIDADGVVAQILENGSQTLALVEAASAPAVGSVVTGSEVVRDAVGVTDGGSADQFFFGVAPNPPVVVGPDPATGFLPPGITRTPPLGSDSDTAGDWLITSHNLDTTHTPTPASPYNFPPTASCGSVVSTVSGTPLRAPVSATDPDGTMVSFELVVTPPASSMTIANVVPAATPGGTATADVSVSGSTSTGGYLVTVTARNGDTQPQLASCQLAVTVEPPPVPSEPSMDDFHAMLDARVAAGDVAAGKAHLLADRLARVDRFLASGQDAAAGAQLQALANQVLGLSPRWVTAAAAEELAGMAHDMAASLFSN